MEPAKIKGVFRSRDSVIRKYELEQDRYLMGLIWCNVDHRFVWGYKHGQMWLGPGLNRMIISVVNRVMCFFTRHETTELQLAQEWKDSRWPMNRRPCCCHCGTPLVSSAEWRRMQSVAASDRDLT